MGDIGREIKRLREEIGWSQAELAVYAGSSQPTVNQIESGKRNPSTQTLGKLASALGVEVSDLFPKAQAPLQLELEEQAGRNSQELNEPEQYAAERRYLIPLLESYSSYLTELSKGHKPFFANLSKDLPPSTSFAVSQRVKEFMYTCDLLEHTLDENGVMAA